MNEQQLLTAFIGALLKEAVTSEQIDRAVLRVLDLKVGMFMTRTPMEREFAFSMARRLETTLRDTMSGTPGST